MNRPQKLFLNALIGLIVIAITLVVFFVGFFGNDQKQTIDYLALLFVLIAEVALFGGMLALTALQNSGDKVFLDSGFMSILVIYWLVTAICSILANPVFKGNLNWFITIQVVIAGTAVIMIISLFLAASNIHNKNATVLNAGMILQDCEDVVYSLLNNKQYQNLAGQLNNLYEQIKFSDKSTCLAKPETEIRLKIIELNDGFKDAPLDETAITEVTGKIENIMALIKVRNMAVKQSKGGRY